MEKLSIPQGDLVASRLMLLVIGLGMGGSLKAEGFGDGGFKKSQYDSMFVLDARSFRHHVDFL